MKQEHMMEAMNHIDPALVEGADRCGGEARRGKWRKLALIAACLCLGLINHSHELTICLPLVIGYKIWQPF